MPYTDLSIHSCSFLKKWQPSIQQNWLINFSSNKQKYRNQKVRPQRQYRRYRADFTKSMSKYVYLTDGLADVITHFFWVSVINFRIRRLNVIVLPSDCTFNHYGEVFSSKETPTEIYLIRTFSCIISLQTTSEPPLNTNPASRSLTFLKSFCLVTS